ncbi:MAG TPA: hypothetical protein VK391_07740 [Allosphingosinicella sp.]|nr:hypothetical protein [Allosphingosinicella sp.]
MIARGFKPVGWVAAVAGAALGCYMLSLNVAAERAELAKLEWKIVMAKRDIRSLQTELGTRGRLQQLENWNANVLALSAPTSNQFLDNELTLARFDQREKTFEESGKVQLASAEAPQPQSAPQPMQQAVQQPRVVLARYEPEADAPARGPQSLVHRASYSLPVVAGKKLAPEKKVAVEPKKAAKPQQLAEAKPAAPAKTAAKKPLMLDDKLIKDIGEAAKSEKAGSAGGR